MNGRSQLAAWADLWRTAPARDKADLIRLACLTPSILIAFAELWGMLP